MSRGFDTAGCPTAPLVGYQINRQLSGWYFPQLLIRAFGAHWPPSAHALTFDIRTGGVHFYAQTKPFATTFPDFALEHRQAAG